MSHASKPIDVRLAAFAFACACLSLVLSGCTILSAMSSDAGRHATSNMSAQTLSNHLFWQLAVLIVLFFGVALAAALAYRRIAARIQHTSALAMRTQGDL